MKSMLVVCCLLVTAKSFAQKTIDVDKSDGLPAGMFYSVSGEPYVNTKFVRLVSGSPFFRENWLKATAITHGTTTYQPGVVKLDLLDNQLIFRDAAGTEILATVPVSGLTLTDTITGESFAFFHSALFASAPPPQKGWFLQLASGQVALYQFLNKQVKENRPYGSATTEQSVVTKNEFYLLKEDGFHLVKKAKDLAALLPDKQQELTTYLTRNNMATSGKPQDLASLAVYYNSLF